MPRPPLSPDATELALAANPAVLATVREDGSPHTVAVDGENCLRRPTIRDRSRVTAWLQPEHWFLWDARGRV